MPLLEHNQQTLDEIEGFVSRSKNCCVVNPCGSGKTSVMASFVKQHRESTFLVLTKQKNAAEYYQTRDRVFSEDRVHIATYAKMLSDCKRENIEAYKADYFLIDEAHYLGAPKWGEAFTKLTAAYKPRLIGFTATPQRYADKGTDKTIVTDFFSGNAAGNFTTKDLEKRGVFVEPEYVLSIYGFDSIATEKMDEVMESDLDDRTKTRLLNRLQSVYDSWKRESSPDKIFGKYLPRFMYRDRCNRMLVYVPNAAELPDRKKAVDKMIRDVFPSKKVTSYVYPYMTSDAELNRFLEDDDSYIKILYSIDKVMETIHLDDLRIAIMLRPSVSDRIITQQFGRINSIANKQKPLIIDMVDNLHHLASGAIRGTRDDFVYGEGSARTQTGLGLPHISSYLSVFDEIEQAVSKYAYYSYQGFTGSLRDLCYVYGKDLNDMERLVKMYPIDECVEMARDSAFTMTQAILDDEVEIPDFTLSADQVEYAEANAHILEHFIARRAITDEDICQNLWLKYLYSVWRTDGKSKTVAERNQRIATYLRTQWLAMLRQRNYHSRCRTDQFEYTSQADPLDLAGLEQECRIILNTLTPREKAVVEMYCGFETPPSTFEQIGKAFGVTGNRVSQIYNKAIRKMRNPSRNGRIREYCDA